MPSIHARPQSKDESDISFEIGNNAKGGQLGPRHYMRNPSSNIMGSSATLHSDNAVGKLGTHDMDASSRKSTAISTNSHISSSGDTSI